MEIYIYDTKLNLLGVIDKITSFIWIRRYWSVGEFKLLVPLTAENSTLLTTGSLVTKRGEKELGEINYINMAKNKYGLEEIEVQGKFITSWLDNRTILNQIVANDTSQVIINRIVSNEIVSSLDQERQIPLLQLETNQQNLQSGIINYSSEPFVSCLSEVETLAKASKLGFYINTDVKEKKHVFKIYKGKDYTATSDNPCLFSQDYDNILSQEFTNSIENYKNVCYVAGEEKKDIKRQVVKIGDAFGLQRREFFVDASDITQTYYEGDKAITMTQAQYTDALISRGIKELEQKSVALNFSATINDFGNLEYRKDFDVGDRVTFLDRRWGLKIDSRITEVTESYQSGKFGIEATFGESLPTLLEKLRKR